MNWKEQALELARTTDYSWRKIAKMLNVPKSSVSDWLRKAIKEPPPNRNSEPKVLVLDIETSPTSAWIYSLWGDNVGIDQIDQDFFIMSFSAKWLGSDEIYYVDQEYAEDMEDDTELLKKLWVLLDEASAVLGHNSKKFDVKKINTRFVMAGMLPPSHYKQIDTLEIAKRNFAFTSNKLEYLTDRLCKKYKKTKHNKFPGFMLWKECLKGNEEAWEEMREYNILDVLSTEELFMILAAWDNKIPNFMLYNDDVDVLDDWQPCGYHYTNMGKFQRYRNINTGEQKRSRKNLFSKEKMENLLVNLV